MQKNMNTPDTFFAFGVDLVNFEPLEQVKVYQYLVEKADIFRRKLGKGVDFKVNIACGLLKSPFIVQICNKRQRNLWRCKSGAKSKYREIVLTIRSVSIWRAVQTIPYGPCFRWYLTPKARGRLPMIAARPSWNSAHFDGGKVSDAARPAASNTNWPRCHWLWS